MLTNTQAIRLCLFLTAAMLAALAWGEANPKEHAMIDKKPTDHEIIVVTDKGHREVVFIAKNGVKRRFNPDTGEEILERGGGM